MVLCSNWTPILHVLDLSAQLSSWARGPLAGCCTTTTTHRTQNRSLGDIYVQLYLEGSSQPQQNRTPQGSQGHCLPLSPSNQEHTISLVPSLLLGPWDPRTIQEKTVKLSLGL